MNGLDPVERLKRELPNVGHVQVASFPDRGEPIESDHIASLFAVLTEGGYEGFVGCEYNPRADTRAGLRWAKAWLG
jgi:hydroxypyruvate isomerase